MRNVHQMHALRACLPELKRRSQNILDIGHDPIPWLRTLDELEGADHRLAGCLQNPDENVRVEESPYPITPIELDIWSPLARKGLPPELPGGDYTIITALGLIDHLYHPEPFFRAVAKALRPGGLLVLTAANVSSKENLLRLLGGDGVAPDLDAIVGLKEGPRSRVREYSWRELANVALFHHFVPAKHGFYDVDQEEVRGADPTACVLGSRRGMSHAVGPLLAHPQQLRSHFYLVLRRTRRLPVLPFCLYMLRHATRTTLRFGRDRVSARIRAFGSA